MPPTAAIDDHSEFSASTGEVDGAEVIDLATVRKSRPKSQAGPRCARCGVPIPASRSSSARYCGDACRKAAASVRRRWQRQQHVARTVLAPPTPAPRMRPHPALALLVGLLAGAIAVFGAYRPTEERVVMSPFAESDAKAALELRERLADDTVGPGLAFWEPLCRAHSPMCTAYLAAFVAANAFLKEPMFCPQGLDISQIETRFAADLQWAADKPSVLAANPGAFAGAVLNFAMPCGGKTWLERDEQAKQKQKAAKPEQRHHRGPR